MPTVGKLACTPPDTIISLPTTSYEFTPGVAAEAAAILEKAPSEVFQRLLRDQESEASLLVALKVAHAFLGSEAAPEADDAPAGIDEIVAEVNAVREAIAGQVERLTGSETDARTAVLRQRAPIAMLAGCWLDTISQPATQPSVIVNHLFQHHFRLKGEGNPQRAVEYLRRHALQDEAVYLPDIVAEDFTARADTRPLTALHAAFYLALSRLPANFLPEIVGVHYVFHALGVDDLLYGTAPLLDEASVRETLTAYLALVEQSADGSVERRRLHTAIRLALTLEQEQVAMLCDLAKWRSELPLDAKAAEILKRHAAFAGGQHRRVKVGDRLLADVLSDPDLDFTAFMTEFRDSRHLRQLRAGGTRFTRALKFGGPMFGVFDEREAAILNAWAEGVQQGAPGRIELPEDRVGDDRATRWRTALAHSTPESLTFAEPGAYDDRLLFHRLVNAENFANFRPVARERAEQGLADGEILLAHGADGKYTDASYFEYTPQALLARVERIYWDKLVDPYQPLKEIPGRDEVIFNQMTFALANLIDGTWACRIGNLGRFNRRSDGMLFGIYADEMGRGDVAKNHVTIFNQVLDSMSIRLPHIRDEDFLEQGEIPDSLYGFSIHQICLSLFPDSYYNELLGYNLAIEMFGLGELRMHEMEKLHRHGFDTAYEKTHLSIDNFSAGHARESAKIIISYLDDVRRTVGADAVQQEWRRIWRGYASFAYFVEHALVTELDAVPEPPQRAAAREDADLVI
jgi:hypothetical protein